MDDVLKRLGVLEKDVSEIKISVGGIVAQLGHMATKADVAQLKADVAQLPYMATKADVAQVKADVAQLPYMATKADVSDAKVSIIQWVVATTIAVAALAFAIAKFVH